MPTQFIVQKSAFPDSAPETLRGFVEKLGLPPLSSITESSATACVTFQADVPQNVFDESLTNLVMVFLNSAKQDRYNNIDAKTDLIIGRGFVFSGMTFSTSMEAQARMLGMLILSTNPLLQYPIIWNNLDDTGAITLPDAAMVQSFVLTGIGYYRAAIDSGSTLKAAVRGAVDIAAVRAIVDTRS